MFFLLVFGFSLKPSGILTWIGKILNPLFLVFLSVLIIAAFLNPMGSIHDLKPVENYRNTSFFTGFLEGYNTMDALASLAFGIIITFACLKTSIGLVTSCSTTFVELFPMWD